MQLIHFLDIIGQTEKQFHGTSLAELRQVNIQEMKNILTKEIGNSKNPL